MGGARKTDFIKMVEQTAEEIDEYLLALHNPNGNEFEDLPTPRQIEFCNEFLSNGYKLGPAAKMTWPEVSDTQSRKNARTWLKIPRVQRYLARQLHDRRLRLGVTAEWICKKYLHWATLDITEFVDFEQVRGRRRPAVYLKKSFNKLPPLVRQSIKSLTVDDKGRVRIEFIDQKSALDSLSKMLGYAQDKIDVEGNLHLHFDKQDGDA